MSEKTYTTGRKKKGRYLKLERRPANTTPDGTLLTIIPPKINIRSSEKKIKYLCFRAKCFRMANNIATRAAAIRDRISGSHVAIRGKAASLNAIQSRKKMLRNRI
jgi:hypothetical protein